MKKRVHKNQIVITTLAVLIAVAGYVTYDKKGADIKDAETVANMNQGAVSDQADKDYETGEDLDITSSKEDLANASTEDVENPGETVLTSVTSGDSDYAAKVKLNREQVRSKNKETLQAIIDCPRKAGGRFCLLTDAQLKNYSATVGKRSHIWAYSQKPKSPEKVLSSIF